MEAGRDALRQADAGDRPRRQVGRAEDLHLAAAVALVGEDADEVAVVLAGAAVARDEGRLAAVAPRAEGVLLALAGDAVEAQQSVDSTVSVGAIRTV